MDKRTIAFLKGKSKKWAEEEGEYLEEEIAEDRFVWADPKGYQKLMKYLRPIALIALLVGVIPYAAVLRQFTDGLEWAVFFAVLVAVILLLIFRKKMGANTPTYILYDGLLYRLSDANRAITIVAEDNDAEWPDFRRDFRRAKKGNTCWRILKVYGVEKRKHYYLVNCKICKSKSGKEQIKAFRIGEGYLNMESLLAQLEGMKEASK